MNASIPSPALRALAALWSEAALPRDALKRAQLPGADPVVPSSFRVAAALQAAPEKKAERR